MPIFPIFLEPGSTCSPSSVITITPGFMVNLAVPGDSSLEETEEPIPPSVDPIASISIISWCFKRPSLTSALHITPLDMMVFTLSKL